MENLQNVTYVLNHISKGSKYGRKSVFSPETDDSAVQEKYEKLQEHIDNLLVEGVISKTCHSTDF